MIVVFADDLTGATEIGGIALRYGLKVEVNLGTELQSDADLLVVAANTRSMILQEALDHTAALTRQIKKLQPKYIFKKIDSVLRGYVGQETAVHLAELGLDRALIVPCNISLKRTIVEGQYLVDGMPLHQTGFARDPEFPALTSDVKELLQSRSVSAVVRKPADLENAEGLIIGEATTEADLEHWANSVDGNILTGGGAEFFNAFLKILGLKRANASNPRIASVGRPVLVVSGTAYQKSTSLIKELQTKGEPVSYMPAEVLRSDDEGALNNWCAEIVKYLKKGKAIIAIDPDATKPMPDAKVLRYKMGLAVARVFREAVVPKLIIEGGATAGEVLAVLGHTSLYPIQELSLGIIRMQSGADEKLNIILKIGSYEWPAHIRPDNI